MRRRIALLIALGLAALTWPSLSSPPTAIVWNATASAPIGLYAIMRGSPRRGDLVLIHPPPPVRNLTSERGYLASRSLLIKRVVAIAGERVCRLSSIVWVQRHRVVFARTADGQGRMLPAWRGCRMLRHGQIFVVGRSRDSFDSRYFGPIDVGFVVGIARPIWMPSPN